MSRRVTHCESASRGAAMGLLFSLKRLTTLARLPIVAHSGDVGQLDNTVNLLQNQFQCHRRRLPG